MRELRERAEPILKIICLILAVLVVCELGRMIIRWNPFRGVTVPALPTLAGSTNAPAGGGHGTNLVAAAGKGTNTTQHSSGTNTATSVIKANTNSVLPPTTVFTGTNSVAITNLATSASNVVTRQETGTNSIPATNAVDSITNLSISTTTTSTNTASPATNANTNLTASVVLETTAANADTNVVAPLETQLSGTNSAPATNAAAKGTNILLSASAGTNTAAVPKPNKKRGSADAPPEMAGMSFNPGQPPGKSSVELPPAVKSRISKITDSEILGPVMRPLPMGLLGIAGEFAFLRSANGQTGLVKAGDSLDDIKLLHIGINRVLIEQGGEKKELMIFDGYGGDSLLQKNTTNENNHP